MRTGILLTLLCCTMLLHANPIQQILYPNRRHSTSHGGYITARPGFSHKGGLFRRSQPKMIKPEVTKPKPLLKNNLQQKPVPQVY